MVTLSPLTGYHYPLSQAFLIATLLALGGLVFYAPGFLLSEVVPGEYAAPGIAMAIIAAFYVLTKLPRLDFLNLFDAMDGKQVLVGRTFYLGSTYPLPTIAWSLIAALVLLVLSVIAVQRRDL